MAARDDLPTLDVASRGTEFVDNEGRTLTLRGVNLGGAKLPAGYRSDESEAAGDDASYVGRPFPLSEAAEHLGRLRAWGFNIVRLSVTWDALEHMQYPEGFVVELSDGDYTLERAPDRVGGYCILRYTPGPPGYVSIVVVKRVGADDPPGRSCCAHSPDEALLPSKPSSETLLEM